MNKLKQLLRIFFSFKPREKTLDTESSEKSPYLKNLLSSNLFSASTYRDESSLDFQYKPINKNGRLYNPFDWIRHILLWTNAQVVCLGIIAATLWLAVLILQSRNYRVIDLPKPIVSQIQDALDTGDGISDTDIERNAHMVLYILNSFTFASPPKLTLLQGIVSPNIISSSESSYSINKKKMDDSSLIQSVTITSIPRIQKNTKNRRISVLIEGFIGVLTQPNNSADLPSRTVPYRAELTYIVRPPSPLNGKETLYLLQITEASGTRDVSIFDETFNNLKK